MKSSLRYHLEITTFAPEPQLSQHVVDNAKDVLPLVPLPYRGDLVVVVMAIAENVDYGNLYIFVSVEGRARVILHEHREFFPRSRGTGNAGPEVSFKDEAGHVFRSPYALTLSQEEVLSLLSYWLPGQAHAPEFE